MSVVPLEYRKKQTFYATFSRNSEIQIYGTEIKYSARDDAVYIWCNFQDHQFWKETKPKSY